MVSINTSSTKSLSFPKHHRGQPIIGYKYSARALFKRSSTTFLAPSPGPSSTSSQRHHHHVIITAAASTQSPSSNDTQSQIIYQKNLQISNNANIAVTVIAHNDGSQDVVVTTHMGGRLLMHWGVEGGKGYKGGWRLPGSSCRPHDTVEYKKRALQTPFTTTSNGNGNGSATQEFRLHLPAEEASDYFDFVLKDTISEQWYDAHGNNFKVPLRSHLINDLHDDQSTIYNNTSDSDSDDGNNNNTAIQSNNEQSSSSLLPLDKIPLIPQDLSGVWSFMKWEAAGCPSRSQDEADAEYNAAIQEVTMLLRQGVTLDTLKQVAEQGVQRYTSFINEHKATTVQQQRDTNIGGGGSNNSNNNKQQSTVVEQVIDVPEELINIKAYLLWESAGKPDGADFGQQARDYLIQEIQSGKSLSDIEAILKSPPPPSSSVQEQQQQEQQQQEQQPSVIQQEQQQQPPSVQQQPEQAYVDVGSGMGLRERNPLDLVHRYSPPKLADTKATKKERPLDFLIQDAGEDESCVWYRSYPLGSKAELLVSVWQDDTSNPRSPVRIVLTTDAPADMILHWGVKKAGRKGEWKRPSESILPPESTLIKDGIAAETPFSQCTEDECHVEIGGAIVPLQRAEINLPEDHGLTGLLFVIRSEDSTRWWNDGGSNFNIPVPGPRMESSKHGDAAMLFEDELSRVIVDCEVNSGAWTLMHRFNKAADLIGEIVQGRYQPSDQSMAKIFVWLRYSAIRQLTWQRNYNTQPRILGAAQERLTHVIADAYSKLTGPSQEWARMCLTTVGRGSNAQAVRDEILNIMHRNKIPEVKGTWMEEFHQKLHNNTTPDDVPICEAYIAFLNANGDINAYWRTLSDHGITRSRLESFDRPIINEPTFFQEKKDALIKDFSNYLGILKATHSGADLHASAAGAASHIPGSAKGYLGYVLTHGNNPAVLPLIEAAVEVRTELVPAMTSNRELIYLDLALENVVRAAAERGAAASGTGAATLLAPLLQNLALSVADNEEVCYCLKAWMELPYSVRAGQRPDKDDALRAMAVIDRIRRALGAISDGVVDAIGSVSAAYGEAFGCESWAVQLFPEEIVRGGPAFAVSLVITSIEPALRSAAELGAWQVISPASAVGRLVVVPSLYGIQDTVYEEPTVLLARRVTGEEEVPLGVVAVLSGDAPDVLSHLSVRARNMRILFAGCYKTETLDEVASAEGQFVELSSTAAGAVTWSIASESSSSSSMSSSEGTFSTGKRTKLKVSVPKWIGKWAVEMDSFKDNVVGAKSKNLAGLRGRLPASINLPASVTVPFGSFEEALKSKENIALAKELAAVVASVTHDTAVEKLAIARELASQIIVPDAAQQQLKDAMKAAGIAVPSTPAAWEAALTALRSVWASKYNDRAYVSTRKVGIPFDDVRMAVLVQRVVPARYAFVIHTTNPMTGDDSEIYCELVQGLGEAIVSGMVPGAALAFVASKNDLEHPRVLLYPSKSEGMFVEDGSLIFRSDSNGEDLEGYAGAGLYDSITTAQTVRRVVDYSSDPIVADAEFARQLMSRICRVGYDIEKALGSAQDIEGVVDPELMITVVQTRPQM